MRNQLHCLALALLTLPAYAQTDVRPDTLDWRGYYPLEIGTTWEWRSRNGFQDLVRRQRIESDTLIAGYRWVVQTDYKEGTYYGQAIAEHDTLLLRYDEPYGRVLARSPVTGEEYDYTCDLSGDFGAEVLCGADLGAPYPIVFEGGYAAEFDDRTLIVGSDTVTFAAVKQDPKTGGGVPPVYFHGVGRLAQPGDGFSGTIVFTYLRLGGTAYGSPAAFVGTEHPGRRPNESIALYPNPVSTTLTVALDGLSRPVTLRVYDLLGRLVLNDSVHCTSLCRLDVRTLPAGFYVLGVDFQRGMHVARRFVVAR